MMERFKRLFVMIIISLVLSSGYAAPQESGGGSIPDWVFKGFDQASIPVSFVVNDILYAGFSSNAIKTDHFAPVTSQLKPIEFLTVNDQSSYYSDVFFIYGIASTRAKIDLQLTFPDLTGKTVYTDTDAKITVGGYNYLQDASKAKGWMYTDMEGAEPKITVYLEGVTSLPYVLPLTPGGDDVVDNVALSNPPEHMLRLRVDKNDMAGEVNGTYHTVLQLTAVIQ